SSMRLPVSMRAVAIMVSEPPSSTFLAAPKKRFGFCSALASTPPVSTLPEAGTTVLYARANRVMESKRMTTSFLCSTRRFAFSITISATWTWALAVLRRADLAFDRVAGMQVEAADLRGRDVDVVGARQVGGLGRAQEAEAVGQHFERAVAEDRGPFLRLVLEQREDEVLLAQAARVLDAVRHGHLDELRDVVRLQLRDVQRHLHGAG